MAETNKRCEANNVTYAKLHSQTLSFLVFSNNNHIKKCSKIKILTLIGQTSYIIHQFFYFKNHITHYAQLFKNQYFKLMCACVSRRVDMHIVYKLHSQDKMEKILENENVTSKLPTRSAVALLTHGLART
jgi:hypothetical protein